MARESVTAKRRTPKAPEDRIRARNEATILRAAVELFARKGFDGTRIAEIAEASGLPKANVYYYFETKEAIYATLIERLLKGWDKALEHIRADREPREAIAAYIAAKLDYSRRHGTESRFFANEIMRGGAFLSKAQRRHMQEITRERVDVVDGWVRDGRLRPLDPRHFFMMLWASTQFYADFAEVAAMTLGKPKLDAADYEAARRTVVDVIVAGCLAAESRP
ncbi:TetR family transcriptional regulator [Aquibium carbonis]|uniref:TetR family transcriptional regulator n=1 Tax=Aquibium carbonis TaxID=2495581 RepID=A0A429Z224_9HYPH|nr:TetR/AcrR family transcriptional regulator [Aquibium carbonis]RST87684.1 TetR family transcriptional regulator [Aquibium carbonis]